MWSNKLLKIKLNWITNFRRSIVSRIWRYDFFISYHWDSGGEYAVRLAQRIRSENYDCFLDRTNFAIGDHWVDEGRLALRSAQKLILIGTKEAITSSQPVRTELELFSGRSQQIVPICFGGPIEDIVNPENATLKLIPSKAIWIREDEASLRSAPSKETVDSILRTAGLLTSRRLRTLIAATVICALTIALLTVSAFAIYAELSAERARHQASVQLARRLAAESNRLSSERTDVAILLASHALKTVDSYDEPIPIAQSVLQRLLKEKKFTHLPKGITKNILDIKSAYTGNIVGSNLKQWNLLQDEKNILKYHVKNIVNDRKYSITLKPDGDPVGKIFFDFSADSRWLVTSRLGVVPQFWELSDTSATSRDLPIEYLLISFNYFSPNSRWLASHADYIGVNLWDLSNADRLERKVTIKDHADLTSAVAFSTNSSLLATGGNDRSIHVYRLDDEKPIHLHFLKFHKKPIQEIVFSPNGRWLIAWDETGEAVQWDLQAKSVQSSAVPITSDIQHNASVYFLDEEMYISCGENGCYRQVLLSSRLLISKAEKSVGRNFSQLEWTEFFPDEEYHKTFEGLPRGAPLPAPQEIF